MADTDGDDLIFRLSKNKLMEYVNGKLECEVTWLRISNEGVVEDDGGHFEVPPSERRKLVTLQAMFDATQSPALRAARKSATATKVAYREVTVPMPKLDPKECWYTNNEIHTTRFNACNFFPKQCHIQFAKLANIYFLFNVVLSIFPAINTSSPIFTIFPFLFVTGLSAGKDAMEDLAKKREDDKINCKPTQVIRQGAQHTVQWKDVELGDIVTVKEYEEVPADMVLLSTRKESDGEAVSDQANSAFIDTAALDGETNFKEFQSHAETGIFHHPTSFEGADFVVSCETPNRNLYSFDGTLHIHSSAVTADLKLTAKQVLLRGHTLRNTYCATGIVVYTGHETKIAKNNDQDTQNKMSQMDRTINRQLYTLFILLAICCVVCAIGAAAWCSSNLDDAWYLELEEGSPDLSESWYGTVNSGLIFILAIFSFNLQFSYMIPISLYVTVEFCKFFTGKLIGWDLHMYSEIVDKPARCRNTNIVEELGQVDYVLSDKTGTLTQNKMELLKCSIAGKQYGTGITEIEHVQADMAGEELQVVTREHFEHEDSDLAFYDPALNGFKYLGSDQEEDVQGYWLALVLCSPVLPVLKEDGTIKYNAASPDDGALVKAAKNLGASLQGRATVAGGVDEIEVDLMLPKGPVRQTYQVLATLEFTSARKRMSVVVKYPDGRIFIISKGADNFIRDRLEDRDAPIVLESQKQADHFAEQGLRVLFVAHREVSEEDVRPWLQELHEAHLQLGEAGEKAVEVAEALFETDMRLLGVTAIEDKLQRNVGRTLSALREADIRTWVLTGDKVATAIMIGLACELITPEMDQAGLITIFERDEATDEKLTPHQIVKKAVQAGKKAAAMAQEPEPRQLGLVIEGAALFMMGIGAGEEDIEKLPEALREELPELRVAFIQACKEMTAVLCCRVSPKQKADLTTLVKETLQKVTLGIGDGANDVGMIKNAHVGVGVEGVEGSQAVNSADFAITEFQHLQNLLLLHGRWTYRRIGTATCYFFYKSVSFCMTLVWYTFYSGFGGNYFYDTWLATIWSPIFTLLPVVAYALLEQDIPYGWSMKNPELYKEGPRCVYLNSTTFLLWIGNAFYDSIIVFFFTWFCMQTLGDGRTSNFEMTGLLMYGEMLIVVTVRLAVQTQHFNWVTFLFYFISIAVYFLYLFLECAVVAGIFTTLYWAIYNLLGTVWFWLTCTMVCASALLPAYTYKTWQILFTPTTSHRILSMYGANKAKKRQKARQRQQLQSNAATRESTAARRRTITAEGIFDTRPITKTFNQVFSPRTQARANADAEVKLDAKPVANINLKKKGTVVL